MHWNRQNQFVIAGDFVIAGQVIAGIVSPYFTVILPSFQMLFVITGSALQRGSLSSGVPLYMKQI